MEIWRTSDLAEEKNLIAALQGVEVVIHLAARVHVMNEKGGDPLVEYRRVNVVATENLARESAKAGVKRFVFLSSIKVNGEESDVAYRESDPPAPVDPYGVSKNEAEQGLKQVAEDTGMEVVIIRPPLVYGAGVGANFKALIRAVEAGVPLPFASTRNLRSFVCLENLLDLIRVCVEHPSAANQTFLVSDGQDLSTGELLRLLASALQRPVRLFRFPAAILMLCAGLVGKGEQARRLLGSLVVDSSKARNVLAWEPPVTVEQGLRGVAGEL